MNVKSLITTSVIALASASAAQAADVVIPHEAAPVVVAAPTFSWTGFYIGAQIGGFASKVNLMDPQGKEKIFTKEETPKPSGFMGGIYAGSNFDLGNNFILGVETDAVWADQKDTKSISFSLGAPATPNTGNTETDKPGTDDKKPGTDDKKPGTDDKKPGTDDKKPSEDKPASSQTVGMNRAAVDAADKIELKDSLTLKEKWSGATRVRIGYAAADRIMPYVAGGIAYAQVQGINTFSIADASGKKISKKADRTMTMVGYTIGGGVDFAMTDNVLLRAEYRFSDFGKKAFVKDANKISYKTNDFRVGVAYKF
ncbi:outer membrane protein [Bartonella machadoae]|uniref:outer membrane protein n=1 Tax=Bartonella machadoae TaxID=2893471 RepID=UPI001F4CD82D|nr:outer membrane protein [Bartonella machadoae]UNE55472.1 porin family protein [Bartonella machadoae]